MPDGGVKQGSSFEGYCTYLLDAIHDVGWVRCEARKNSMYIVQEVCRIAAEYSQSFVDKFGCARLMLTLLGRRWERRT